MNSMPLLSRPPPENPDLSDESTCRKCSKEFNFLFARPKRCNHCGYAYCSSCADYQALMPRQGPDTGYDVQPVCSYCMDMLTITASSKPRLRSLPLGRLRSYMKAYDIQSSNTAIEKDDLVDAIIRARGPDGCLRPIHEAHYRMNSVPRKQGERPRARSFFSRERPPHPPTPPPVIPAQTQTPQYAAPPGPPPAHARAGPPPRPQQPQSPRPTGPPPQTRFPQPHPYQHNPSPPQQPYRQNPQPAQQPHHFNRPPTQTAPRNTRPSASQTNFHSRPPPPPPFVPENQRHRPPQPPPPRPRSAGLTVPPTPAAPPPPVPSLDELLEKSSDEISKLSISTLKTVLFQNRVNSSLGVLEKADLVRKVLALVDDEQRDRQRKDREERAEREEAERMGWARREREKQEEERKAAERERKLMEERRRQDDEANAGAGSEGEVPKPMPQPASPSPPYVERTQDGLCVVCQDEHANMAIIDCGHLALCKACSEMVMKSTRECPLCRTRIVTEQRLLRIFKT